MSTPMQALSKLQAAEEKVGDQPDYKPTPVSLNKSEIRYLIRLLKRRMF